MGSSNGDNGISVHLCEDAEVPVGDRYITLSHCWGTLEHIRLTKSTLSSFKKKIAWESLSRTFQDAVVITRNLDVKWLWIDSLCIIQDSLEDWTIESKNMQSIYANAFCNISAADAKDGTEGCFRSRNPLAIQPCKIMLDGKTRYVRDSGSWDSNIDLYSINSRAWVMQERLLSPRILYYTKDQIIWECREGLASEALPMILPRRNVSASLFNDLIYNWSSGDTERGPALSNDDIRKAWNLLVSRYSRCLLTRESDKLMALEGLTSRVRELRGEQDVFGLWPTDIELQLTWQIASGKWGKHAVRRLPSQIAPSWSWASVHGWEILPEHGDLQSVYSYRTVSHARALWNPSQPTTNDIPADQHQGFLALRCMLLPAKVETVHVLFETTQATPIDGRGSSVLYCYLDTDDDRKIIHDAGQVWCAPLFTLVSKERDPELRGLLLVQNMSEEKPTFRRVGTFGNTIELMAKSFSLRLPRPVDLPLEERPRFDLDSLVDGFKDKGSSANGPDIPSREQSKPEFDTSGYDMLVKKCLQDRFPSLEYPGADKNMIDGIEEHSIILC